MEWEDKVKMVQLGNQSYESEDKKKRVPRFRFR